MDIGDLILKALARRVDPETGLVRPLWKKLAQEVGVSRSTLARQLAELRARGAFEVVFVRTDPDQGITYYRLAPKNSNTLNSITQTLPKMVNYTAKE